jgi:hypothetical protein
MLNRLGHVRRKWLTSLATVREIMPIPFAG